MFSLSAHPEPSTVDHKVSRSQPLALYSIKTTEKRGYNFYLALQKRKRSNCRLIQFYVGDKYTQKRDTRGYKCDFLNKIIFQPCFNNMLYLHTFSYTAKRVYIHYHSGYSSKALEKRAGTLFKVLQLTHSVWTGTRIPVSLSYGSGSLPYSILPTSPHIPPVVVVTGLRAGVVLISSFWHTPFTRINLSRVLKESLPDKWSLDQKKTKG